MAPLPATDQRHPWLRYQIEEYTEGIRTVTSRGSRIYGADRLTWMSDTIMDLYTADTLCFQLGGVRRRMTWRQFILALGLHTKLEMAEAGFRAYCAGSDRLIPDKGDLRDYWLEILSDRDFLGPALEKVTCIDLFYLCSMDRGTINVPHLLAQYLFRHATGRKSGARLLGASTSAREADKGDQAAEEVTLEIPAPAPAHAPLPPPPAL
ncbi:hypothetical protein Tco_1542546 [Tanacetum coccineum]